MKLEKRFELKCAEDEYRRWKRAAKDLGYPSVATLLRIATDDFLSRKLRERQRLVQARTAEAKEQKAPSR